MATWFDRLFAPRKHDIMSRLRSTVCVKGTFYKVSDLRGASDIEDIRTQINVMRALARDSQVSTALNYYATDATTANSAGDIIWATAIDDEHKNVADIINQCFKRWRVNDYARDHILELATMGQIYIPTTEMYREPGARQNRDLVALDKNSLTNIDYDIVPSYMIPPEDIIHLWYKGEPQGFVYQPSSEDTSFSGDQIISYPESSILSPCLPKLNLVVEQNQVCAISFSFSSRGLEGLVCMAVTFIPSLMEPPLSGVLIL